jgi:hypothetical protein
LAAPIEMARPKGTACIVRPGGTTHRTG